MKNIAFKLMHFLGLWKVFNHYSKDEYIILNLHRISPEKSNFFPPIHPDIFEHLLLILRDHFEITNFKNLNYPSDKTKLILSFDDGYSDFIEYALPILRKYSLPSNHNVVNACLNGNHTIWTEKLNLFFEEIQLLGTYDPNLFKEIGIQKKYSKIPELYLAVLKLLLTERTETRENLMASLDKEISINKKLPKMMTWEDAAYCLKHDVELGSHSYTHPALSTEENEDVLKYEIEYSIQEMEEKLNQKIQIFSFPNSSIGKYSREFIQRMDIKYALLLKDQSNKISDIKEKNFVNRFYMMNESIPEALFRISGFHYKVKSLQGKLFK